MSRFYSILLDDEMHDSLRKLAFETGQHVSALVRKGIRTVLVESESRNDEDKTQEGQ